MTQASDNAHTGPIGATRQQLREALGELSRSERLLLIMYYADGMTPAEIACLLGEHSATPADVVKRIADTIDKIRTEVTA